MEIINGHVHLIELGKMAERHPDLALPAGISVLRDLEKALPMLLPETLLAQMDEAGISKSVLYAVDAPVVFSSNEYVHALCRKHPDRFIGFASVDPKRKDAADVLERAVGDLGLRGLKLHPPLQDFFPDDERAFPVYEKCLELSIPVVFHVGSTPFGSLCRLAQASPLRVDEVAVRFPELRIMLTHLGTLWHNEAFMVVEKNPNVFIDTAAYVCEIRDVLKADMAARIGEDKIVFGTDYPMPYAGRPHCLKEFVDCVRQLPFPDEVLSGIFSGNFHRFLNGDQRARQTVTPMELMAMARELTGQARDLGQDRESG